MLYVHYYYAAEDDDADDDDGGDEDEDDDDGGDEDETMMMVVMRTRTMMTVVMRTRTMMTVVIYRCVQCVGDCCSSFSPLGLALYANVSTTTSCWRVAHQHHQRLVKERGLPCVATPAGD